MKEECMLPKIVMIICWYGAFPWYFRLFLHSCGFNNTVDFIIITDNTTPVKNKPANVRFVYRSLNDIRNLATERLGFPVVINDPYKLCDLRPAYGYIFSELAKGYDFWGHADIDVIYGDIRKFISAETLSVHDIISVRNEYITGFFALYRNTDKVNRLFTVSRDYQKIFSQPQYCGFDECGLLCDALAQGVPISMLQDGPESMTHVVKKLESEGSINAYFDFHVAESIPGNIEFNNGQLTYLQEYEILLYHLVSFKVHPDLQVPAWDEIPSSFKIHESSFSA